MQHNDKHPNINDMNKSTFIISDESVNSYGYIVKTDGIDFANFERNPVMLYMHERKTVVGRWENIRKEGKKLLADAVFDEATELGRTVKSQVENGFLRSASIGVDILEERVIDGVNTVTKSLLHEVSIVDIPSNKNALKLYRKGIHKRLTLEMPSPELDLRSAIIELLDLAEDAEDKEIISAVKELANAPDEASKEVETAVKEGLIYGDGKSHFITMARVSPQAFHSFISGEKEKRKKAVLAALDAALSERRITYEQKDIYARIGQVIGLETLSALLVTIPKSLKISEFLKGKRSGWTLADYRKYAPDELKQNPKLYAELVNRESTLTGGAAGGKQTLEYLRKNNPKYLAEHPEEYERLLATL